MTAGASLPPIATAPAPSFLPRPSASEPAKGGQLADGKAADVDAVQQTGQNHGGNAASTGGDGASHGKAAGSGQAATSAFAEVPENKKQVRSDFATATPRLESPKEEGEP